jgi:hypothetical protein
MHIVVTPKASTLVAVAKKPQTGCDVESWKLLGRTNFQGRLTEELPRIDLGPTEHQVVSESL